MTAPRILLLFAALAACDTLPEPRFEGKHIRVGTSPGLEPCAGNLAHMDQFVARMAAEMGVAAPTGDDRFTFYWLTDDDYLAYSPCPREVTACTLVDTIHSHAAMLDHELVHLFAYDSSSFFAEGFAAAYEGLDNFVFDHGESLPPAARRDLWSSLLSVLWFGVNYDTAGVFVAYLLDRHGVPAVQAALPKFPLVPSRAGIDRIFRDEFGVSLADSVAAFMASRESCPKVAYDRKLMECDAPRIVWDGARHAEYRRLAADEPDALGPFGPDGLLVLRSIDIPADGAYELQIVVDPRADNPAIYAQPTLSLLGCGRCDDLPAAFATTSRRRVDLRAGRYSLRLHGSTRADTRVAWSITRADDTTPR